MHRIELASKSNIYFSDLLLRKTVARYVQQTNYKNDNFVSLIKYGLNPWTLSENVNIISVSGFLF